MNAESRRLTESAERHRHWKRWGPYLSERAWGTVREDYSASGDAWNYFPFDHAASRAYRWNEDGLAGICDRHQHICFALALWNGHDRILKERLFGLTGPQGNHGEDVKEYYYFLDSTPTHSYMRFLYKYPQAAFPYDDLLRENARRTRAMPEYELLDTRVFDEHRYFDVFVEYAKATPDDVLVRITVENRGPEEAALDVLPSIWFRNRWSWSPGVIRPVIEEGAAADGTRVFVLQEERYGRRYLYCEGAPQLLFTENETNTQRIFGAPNRTPYVKDGIGEYVVSGKTGAVNPALRGTKAAARYCARIPAGGNAVFQLRFCDEAQPAPFGQPFEDVFVKRRHEADDFYAEVIPRDLSEDGQNVMRQALGGLLWSKQYYHYVVREWLAGDPAQPPPPPERLRGRNHDWPEIYNADVISMPDTWEYPWYASWDLAFHCIPLSLVDSEYAKSQLILLLREWYMKGNGQLPAYEWNFSD
ncbi:MAG TPA: hypothetical protein VG871_12685, partial [Vicinamibacterales bacterium]|nr:hypothetical protein [Vicinamibacterales bacterium]